MTNKEWLNTLSVKQFADIIWGADPMYCTETKYCDGDCKVCAYEWLKKERDDSKQGENED